MIPIAKGKFSQPRQPRRDDGDFTAYQRPTQPITPVQPPESEPDPTLAETMYMPEGFVPGEEPTPAPQREETIPQETISFEETLFLQETAIIPPPAPAPRSIPEEYYDEDDEYEEVYEKKYKSAPVRKKSKARKVLLVSICAVTLLLLVAIIGGIMLFVNSNKDDGLILNNVTVAGVNIGGMTPEEAATAIHRVTDLTYSQENMVITLPDTILELSPQDTKAKLDVAAVVQAAYNYGRTGTAEEIKAAQTNSLTSNHVIALLPYLNLDQDFIRQKLEEYGAYFNSDYENSSYKLEGNIPELSAEKYDPNAPCQTLILKPGKPGRYVDIEKIFNDVLDAYSMNIFKVDTNMTGEEQTPDPLDLDAIHEMFHTDSVDASMDMETFEVTPETYGYTFDLGKAKELLSQTEYGSVVEIPMEYVVPKVLGSDLEGTLFRDVLATCETPHTDNANRNSNLKLACDTINGYILMPGDTFDYNVVLGERTEERGYLPAGALSAGTSITEIGGGICQVSSTLYYCTLLSDMEIVTRRSHSLVSNYITMGMDATVSWGGPEFRFKNNTDYPIQIQAEVSGGYVRVSLLGTDDKNYYVEMEYKIVEVLEPETQYEEYTEEEAKAKGYKDGQVIQQPITGYTVYSYKCKYDKETKELISRDYEATSNYVRKHKIVVKVLEEETVPPTTEPPATEPPATEPPATEAPKATEPPATEPPATEAPKITEPPATEPPATEAPKATEPPATEPPATEAPKATEPPATEPPATEAPKATEPPAAEPPATEPAMDGI